MSNFKKAFTITVTVMTVMWSVGVSFAPIGASAAASAGDLIKMAGNPAVYYFDGAKRYVFPNQTTYMTWYKDFSGVKTIPADELSSYPIGGNVTMRPGTYLAKITTDPKVYAVEPGGMLRHVTSEAIAMSLYGSMWNKKVVDVPDAFFVNYKTGSSITTAMHPTGSLVKYANSATWYYVDNGVKRPFASDAALAANMMNSAMFGIETTITYPDGSSITGQESALVNVSGSASSVVPGGTGLTVALASDTPVSASVPKSGTNVKFLALNFTAGSDGSVVLDGFTLRRMGVGSASNFSGVYVYDGSNRLTSARTINSTSNEVTFTGLNTTIPAGSTKKLWVTADIASSITSGQTSNLVLEAANKVTTTTTGVAVSGSFPVTGNMMTFVDVTIGTLTITKSGSVSPVKVGQQMAKVSEFKLAASTEDIDLMRVALYQGGSISRGNLSNFKLRVQGSGSDLATVAAISTKDLVVFELATPYTITQGNDRIFEVYADVAANARTTDDIKLYVEETTDISATGRTFGYGVIISNGSFNAAAEAHDVNVEGGQLTISFEGPSNTTISKNTNDYVVFKFNLVAAQAMEIRKMSFALESPGESDAGDDTSGLINGDSTGFNFTDIKVKDLDSGLIMTASKELGTSDDDSNLDNPAPYTDNNPDQIQVVTFTDFFTLNAGTTRHFALLTDIEETNPDANDLKVYMLLDAGQTDFTAKSIDTSDFITDIVPSVDLTGNTITVRTATLTIGQASTPISDTFVKRSNDVPAVGFTFQAGTSSDVTVTSVKLTGYVDNTASGTFTANTDGNIDINNLVSSVRLYEGDDLTKPVSEAKSLSSDGTVTFSGLSWKIVSGTTAKLVVRMNVSDSVATNNRVKFDLAGTADTGNGDPDDAIDRVSDVTAQDKDANSVSPQSAASADDDAYNGPNGTTADSGIRITFATAGTLSAIEDASTPVAGIVLAGSSNVLFTAVKWSATREDFQVKKFNVTQTTSGANDIIGAIRVSYPGASGTVNAGPYALDSNGTAAIDISSNPMIVSKSGSAVLSIYADVASFVVIDGSQSGRRPVINLQALNATPTGGIDWEATGVSSGTTLGNADNVTTAVIDSSTQVVYKSKPTLTATSFSTTPSNSEMEVYKWGVAATGGSVAVKQFGFGVSLTDNTDDTLTLGTFKIYRDSTDITDQVTILKSDGTSVEAGGGTVGESGTGTDTDQVYVTFANEETVPSGSTYNYVLRATASGFDSADDDSFRVEMLSDSSVTSKQKLGDLDETDAQIIVNLTSGLDAGEVALPVYLVWSDVSAIPHSATVPEDNGDDNAATSSADWTNGYLVKNLPLSPTSFVF